MSAISFPRAREKGAAGSEIAESISVWAPFVQEGRRLIPRARHRSIYVPPFALHYLFGRFTVIRLGIGDFRFQ